MNSELTASVSPLSAAALLDDWGWLLKDPHELLLVTSMGDAFVADSSGAVFYLDTLEGSLKPVAPSRETFQSLVASGGLDPDLFLPDMVALKIAQGHRLAPGQCYSYKLPPILGGPLESSNVEATDIVVHFSISGQLHRQLVDLPPGTRISGFRVVDGSPPSVPGATGRLASAPDQPRKLPLARRLLSWLARK